MPAAATLDVFNRGVQVTTLHVDVDATDATLREIAERHDKAPFNSHDLAVYRGARLVAVVRKNRFGSVLVTKVADPAPRRLARVAD